jgi:uncharacterized protein
MNLSRQIASQLKLDPENVEATIELLDEGNTIPFIARYRKELTGAMDEDKLRQLQAMLVGLRNLNKRRQTILDTIAGREKLTPELESKILAADSLTLLEDLYRPYKPKRRTRASIAKEKGLQGLAKLILLQTKDRRNIKEIAMPFLSDEVPTIEEAFMGARDIVAETISDNAEVRQVVREKGLRWGRFTANKIDTAKDERGVYKTYYQFSAPVFRLKPYQILAINRGEAEKVLRTKIEVPERDWRQALNTAYRTDRRSILAEQLDLAKGDAAKRLLLPAIERDIRSTLTDQSTTHAISVFAANLRNLLLQPPLSGRIILGIDPGYRTGSKVAVVDSTGRVLDSATIYPHPPQKKKQETLNLLKKLILHHGVELIAIGNGTASRETEQLVAQLIQEMTDDNSKNQEELHYLIVNEAGASVYSASPLARAELPDLDVTIRGAVSIARRVQDPLAELVKIDSRSIGVGMYQHDVNQKDLRNALDSVVESVVNKVGVEVNTASPALLTHVAGVGPKLANNITTHREENGPFSNRTELRKVAGFGPKSFEQAAGFLRIQNGDNPLDASAIHPESYNLARAILGRAGLSIEIPPVERIDALGQWRAEEAMETLATDLSAGVPTIKDVLEQLVRPGRDPREDLPAPILRSDVLSLDDLKPGMNLKGTVRNVVDFGAFVDIGVKNDGLLHRSQWPNPPNFAAGDVIEVTILQVEAERGRISLGWID